MTCGDVSSSAVVCFAGMVLAASLSPVPGQDMAVVGQAGCDGIVQRACLGADQCDESVAGVWLRVDTFTTEVSTVTVAMRVMSARDGYRYLLRSVA
jgi:hypothetical protein